MTEPLFLLPLPALLLGWIAMGGSPGPATLMISGTSMEQGRRAGLLLASGVIAGSACWGAVAALGFAAVMQANVWMFEALRIAGALYLLYLAAKSLRAAWRGAAAPAPHTARGALFSKGLLLHLTNPKAVLGWGSVFAVALAPAAPAFAVWLLYGALISTSMLVFWGYALIFSAPMIARGYRRAQRGFEVVFGLLFGAAALKLLTLKATA